MPTWRSLTDLPRIAAAFLPKLGSSKVSQSHVFLTHTLPALKYLSFCWWVFIKLCGCSRSSFFLTTLPWEWQRRHTPDLLSGDLAVHLWVCVHVPLKLKRCKHTYGWEVGNGAVFAGKKSLLFLFPSAESWAKDICCFLVSQPPLYLQSAFFPYT